MFTELVDGVTLLVFMRLCNITVKVPTYSVGALVTSG